MTPHEIELIRQDAEHSRIGATATATLALLDQLAIAEAERDELRDLIWTMVDNPDEQGIDGRIVAAIAEVREAAETVALVIAQRDQPSACDGSLGVPICSACGARTSWVEDAWVCTKRSCASEWYPDHGAQYTPPARNERLRRSQP